MGLFDSKAKKEAIQKLEEAQRKYEQNGRRVNIEAQSLYNQKKEAIKAIEYTERVLKRQADLDIESFRQIADAKNSIRLFQEAIQNEEKALAPIKDSTGHVVGAGIAGGATGAAIATLGPTAAMALATTFGTAATGTAISALSGAAAANAALAWLGGGAIAAGGGGIAAGTTVLAMFGPIGWALGGITAGTAGLVVYNKNKKIVKEVNETTAKLQSINRKLKKRIDSIKATNEAILKDTYFLVGLVEGPTNDNGQAIYNYAKIVETVKSLCNNINKKFSVW